MKRSALVSLQVATLLLALLSCSQQSVSFEGETVLAKSLASVAIPEHTIVDRHRTGPGVGMQAVVKVVPQPQQVLRLVAELAGTERTVSIKVLTADAVEPCRALGYYLLRNRERAKDFGPKCDAGSRARARASESTNVSVSWYGPFHGRPATNLVR